MNYEKLRNFNITLSALEVEWALEEYILRRSHTQTTAEQEKIRFRYFGVDCDWGNGGHGYVVEMSVPESQIQEGLWSYYIKPDGEQ